MIVSPFRFIQRQFKPVFLRPYSTELSSPLLDAALKDIQSTKPVQKKQLPDFFTTKNMRVSSQKLNHLARLIKGMSLNEAQSQMSMVLKRRGKDIASLIHRVGSVLDHNYQLNKSDFYIKQAWVGKGTYLKRIRIHGRGRMGRVYRPQTHLRIKIAPLEKLSVDPKELKKQEEFLQLKKMFTKHELFYTMKDKKPIHPVHPPWSKKPWKYLTSPKWTDQNAALYRPPSV
ncbi:ribosomal protein L22/L17 [Globomyces pollinis-pini]|nr:ribosomal protein L22/L17 [Globomyces pollinis-pini]